jgi:hypothetical protein
MARPTRAEIIDAIVSEATHELCRFTGDTRDGTAPPIRLENFNIEALRYGAKALRARLSRLSRTQLNAELCEAAVYVRTVKDAVRSAAVSLESREREELSRQQRERAQKPRLQPAILAAARHYRAQNKTYKEAWRAIKKKPYAASQGETVQIETAGRRESMAVHSRDGRRRRLAISESQWRQGYWRAVASKPG